MLTYLGCFTVMKFRRVKQEKIEWKELSKGAEIAKEKGIDLNMATKFDKDFINGKGQAVNQNHTKPIRRRQLSFLGKDEDKGDGSSLPLRSSKTYVDKRQRAFYEAVTEKFDDAKKPLLGDNKRSQ